MRNVSIHRLHPYRWWQTQLRQMGLALDTLHEPQKIPIHNAMLFHKIGFYQCHITLLGEYVLQLFAQHQRIQIRHCQRGCIRGYASICICCFAIVGRRQACYLNTQERHRQLLASMTCGIQIRILCWPTAHDFLIVEKHRTVVALWAGCQLYHHIAIGIRMLQRNQIYIY